MNGIYTVKQVNSYIKNMFTQDFMLNRIYVKGEISNCKYHPSGHIYFSLKELFQKGIKIFESILQTNKKIYFKKI